MRFRHHRPAELMNRMNELKLPRREYRSEMAELPEIRHRITEDEISHIFTDASESKKLALYAFWQQNHTAKEKERYLKDQYGIGGYSGALSNNFHSFLDYEGKEMRFRKPDCGTVEELWPKIVRRVDALIASGRYLTPEQQEKYESDYLEQQPEQAQEADPEREAEQASANQAPIADISAEAAAPQEEAHSPKIDTSDTITPTETDTAQGLPDYAALKLAHEDDIVLYQVGDFYEVYGYEAKTAAETLGISYTMRQIPGLGHVYMCGFPVSALENNLERLREKHDVIVSGISSATGERMVVSFPSIDHEAEQALNAHEAEFGADGNRVFRDISAQEEAPASPKREITQADIDRAIQIWNGNLQSKHSVVRHMEMYGRDRETAEWKAICQGFFYLSFHPMFSIRKMASGAGAW